MQFIKKVPRLLRWIFAVLLLLLGVMTLARLIFFWAYNPPGKAFPGSSFLLGFRYDLRIACVIALAMMIICAIPYLNPFKRPGAKKFWNILLPVLFLIMVLVYVADYYHFDYLHQRLNASVLGYMQDARTSGQMMWQSYPLIKIFLLFIAVTLVARWLLGKLLRSFQQQKPLNNRKRIGLYIITAIVFAQCIIGKIVFKSGQFPLRWSDAYSLKDDFKANLALNPFQSFLSSLGFRNSKADIKKVKAGYPLMAAYLGVQEPDSNRLNFERNYPGDSTANKPNIVVVICESFSAYKSSMYGNTLNTTPYFKSLCDSGIFFDRCFTPAYGTARGVWATITGVPDVEAPPGTASRNPNAVDQHTIINNFKGYNNFYFLGGDATWANIRGLLTNNINGVKLYEGADFKSKPVDVWGISDKNLFLESNAILKEQAKPFFAVIQTADNHRPYTIPSEDKDSFALKNFPTDSLRYYGFESNAEMNAFRYTDFCYQTFIETAKKEKYFDNTIFVFVGDHGIRYSGNLDYFPKAWVEQGLTCEHVPLLFYAPKLLQPKREHDVCSQVDIMPSVASLAKISYHNTTFGRNLFDTIMPVMFQNYRFKRYAFIIDHDVHSIGLVSNDYYYLKNLTSGKIDFVSVKDNAAVPSNPQTENIKDHLGRLTDAYFETAKYLLLNNKKSH